MEKEFVTIEQFRELFELGYDIHDMSIVSTYTQKPLKQQVFRWFREKYELFSFVFIFDEGFGYETFKQGVSQINDSFYTYEEAENGLIDKLIEVAKQQDK